LSGAIAKIVKIFKLLIT